MAITLNGSTGIVEANIADNAITTNKIATGAVTAADIASNQNLQLNTLNASSVTLNGVNKTSWGKAKKQKVQNSIDTVTLNVGSWTTVVSVNITVSAGSDVLVMFNGESNAVAGAAWQWAALFRDNTQIGTTTIEVNQEGWNSNFHTHWWDENVSAGTYTYAFKVYNGSNYCQWGEHSEPTIQAIEFGV